MTATFRERNFPVGNMCQQETSRWTLFDLYPKESTYRIISLKLNKFSRMSLRVHCIHCIYVVMSGRWDANFRWRNISAAEQLFHNLLYYHVPHGGKQPWEAIARPNTLEESRTTTATTIVQHSVDINSIYSEPRRLESLKYLLRKDSREVRFITHRLQAGRK